MININCEKEIESLGDEDRKWFFDNYDVVFPICKEGSWQDGVVDTTKIDGESQEEFCFRASFKRWAQAWDYTREWQREGLIKLIEKKHWN